MILWRETRFILFLAALELRLTEFFCLYWPLYQLSFSLFFVVFEVLAIAWKQRTSLFTQRKFLLEVKSAITVSDPRTGRIYRIIKYVWLVANATGNLAYKKETTISWMSNSRWPSLNPLPKVFTHAWKIQFCSKGKERSHVVSSKKFHRGFVLFCGGEGGRQIKKKYIQINK